MYEKAHNTLSERTPRSIREHGCFRHQQPLPCLAHKVLKPADGAIVGAADGRRIGAYPNHLSLPVPVQLRANVHDNTGQIFAVDDSNDVLPTVHV